MPKGDDYLQKKRTKAVRKRMRRVGADSLEAIQGVQAAKRRRKSGTRRACEGMCYTLPTPDDPFNERNDRRKRRQGNRKLRTREVPEGEILEFETFADAANGSGDDANAGYEKQLKKRKVSEDGEDDFEGTKDSRKCRKVVAEVNETRAAKHRANGNEERRSLNLDELQSLNAGASSLGKERADFNGDVICEMVLDAISESGLLSELLHNADSMNGDSKKGTKKYARIFARHCQSALTNGVDVVALSSHGREERVLGYVVPAAVHIKDQLSKDATFHKPLVLIVVASQDQALQVRSICKPLKKTMGISSVCVHTGTSLESQIRGFSLLTPEIVVASPGRLVELLAVEALSLSSVSFLVIDGLDEIVSKGIQNHLSKLKDHFSEGSRRLIICGKFSKDVVNIARDLVMDPIERVVSEPILESSSVCIAQEVSVFTAPNKRLPKLLKILQQLSGKQEKIRTCSILVLVENAEAVDELLLAIQGLGYFAAGLTSSKRSQVELTLKKFREGREQTLVTTEEFLSKVPLDTMQVVINYSFPSTMQVYERILTDMARRSIHGELHSFCTASMASMAQDLVVVLQKCSQEVPRALQMLADAAALVENGKAVVA
ncbi:unnamed protein product [Calypogeia fissa]